MAVPVVAAMAMTVAVPMSVVPMGLMVIMTVIMVMLMVCHFSSAAAA
jgi:hypothetical protein